MDMQLPGWYLARGSGRQGSVWEIWFPLSEDGRRFLCQLAGCCATLSVQLHHLMTDFIKLKRKDVLPLSLKTFWF
jgi:hypothetical protein